MVVLFVRIVGHANIEGKRVLVRKQKEGGPLGSTFFLLMIQKTLFLFGLFLGDEAAAGFEFGNFLGGNLNGLAGLGVLGGAGLALHNAEGTEANEGHLLAFVQLLLDGGEASVHSLFSGHFGHAGLGGHGVNKFGFVHNDFV
jgi:hypothetical protein